MNVYKYEKRKRLNRGFWGAVPGYVKDGFVFTGESVGLVKKVAVRKNTLMLAMTQTLTKGHPMIRHSLALVLCSGDGPEFFIVTRKNCFFLGLFVGWLLCFFRVQ